MSILRTALYCRLSKDDMLQGDSESIKTQEGICQGVFLQIATLFISGDFATPSEGRTEPKKDTLAARMGACVPLVFRPPRRAHDCRQAVPPLPLGRW